MMLTLKSIKSGQPRILLITGPSAMFRLNLHLNGKWIATSQPIWRRKKSTFRFAQVNETEVYLLLENIDTKKSFGHDKVNLVYYPGLSSALVSHICEDIFKATSGLIWAGSLEHALTVRQQHLCKSGRPWKGLRKLAHQPFHNIFAPISLMKCARRWPHLFWKTLDWKTSHMSKTRPTQ